MTTAPQDEPEAQATPDIGHKLRKQATRLLEQLQTKRPRRSLDLDGVRRLLEVVAAPCDTERLICELMRFAWQWGASCEIDGVGWGEAGDSHNQLWRDRTTEAATALHGALLAGSRTPNAETAPRHVAHGDGVVSHSAPPGYRHDGWLYIDDDGNGPFWTGSKANAERYLASWPVFRIAPPHDGECIRVNDLGETLAYGCCRICGR